MAPRWRGRVFISCHLTERVWTPHTDCVSPPHCPHQTHQGRGNPPVVGSKSWRRTHPGMSFNYQERTGTLQHERKVSHRELWKSLHVCLQNGHKYLPSLRGPLCHSSQQEVYFPSLDLGLAMWRAWTSLLANTTQVEVWKVLAHWSLAILAALDSGGRCENKHLKLVCW